MSLPWPRTTIGDLGLDISDGNYSAKYPKASDFISTGVPFLTANDMKNYTIVDKAIRYISREQHAGLRKGHLKKGDILIATRGELGLLAKVPQRHIGSNINAQLVRINPNGVIDGEYLFQILLAPQTKRQINDLETGSALKQLPVGNLKKIELPLPPIPEQKKIAEILTTWDCAIEQNGKLLRASEVLLKGIAKDVFSKLGKERILISEVCDVRDGTHDSPKYVDSGVPLLTSKNIIDGRINFDDAKLISDSDAVLVNKRSKVDRNDILFSMIGTVGAVALVIDEPNFCIKNVGLFKPNKDRVLPHYLYSYFQTAVFQDEIRKTLDGGIQKFLSLGALRSLKIPLPDLVEQARISELLSECRAIVDLMNKRQMLMTKQKQGLMQKLLTGKVRVKV